ncbi:adhesin [Ornithinibacillus sp. L9]|uniref:Adhesin n=1 Tax=Ornithinibacillus caprae TaxID=2678566 RepID=A0A6N8FKF7_9BACI|nr:zinc ABC transporter substrate-binding protein [Ornithinibacillus caprae]MUK88269.1 adhesin [Ornithinibacillus caprae]
MNKKYIGLILGVLFLTIGLIGCNTEVKQTSNSDGENNNDTELVENKLTIYTTLYPLADFAKKIGGDIVEVESIIPPGSDSHTYEPTSKEMVEIARADAFIFNGLGMEPYAEKISSALENEDVVLIEATQDIETIEHLHEHDHGHEGHEHEDEHEDHEHEDHEHENHEHDEHEEESHEEDHDHDDEVEHDDHGHDHGDLDPHVWLDPYRSIKLAENIKNALVELHPEATEDFEQNYEALKTELENLDHAFHELVEEKENPEMVVSHAAYGYWEETYGIHQIPIAGLSSSDEPSQKDLVELINLATEKDINYIIFEQNITPKVAEVIREEINAEAMYLHNLSVLTDEDIANGEDYFSLMNRNLEVLNQVLR